MNKCTSGTSHDQVEHGQTFVRILTQRISSHSQQPNKSYNHQKKKLSNINSTLVAPHKKQKGILQSLRTWNVLHFWLLTVWRHLKQSQHVLGLEVKVDVVDARSGGQSGHRAHLKPVERQQHSITTHELTEWNTFNTLKYLKMQVKYSTEQCMRINRSASDFT